MIYTFACPNCDESTEVSATISVGPPCRVVCSVCLHEMVRDWKSDAPMLDTSACRDHDSIKEQHRVQRFTAPGNVEREEARFSRSIHERRKQLADGGNRGQFKHTHSVPADLFHGKVRETGDKNYWADPKNLAKHNTCKVSK